MNFSAQIALRDTEFTKNIDNGAYLVQELLGSDGNSNGRGISLYTANYPLLVTPLMV